MTATKLLTPPDSVKASAPPAANKTYELPPPPKWLKQLPDSTLQDGFPVLPTRTRVLKRTVDVCLASVLLVVTAPLMLVAAIAICINSRGSIFFTQTRVGLNKRRRSGEPASGDCRRRTANFGRPFTIFKLRTMETWAASEGPSQAQPNDQRVFAVGRLLRKLRIDELPQLVNVLKGDMSLVGPRPECIEYMEELSRRIPGYTQRLGLKPGLTGIAQIESGYANDLESYQRKIAHDQLYLRNCCLTNDLKILLRTARVVLTGFGAL